MLSNYSQLTTSAPIPSPRPVTDASEPLRKYGQLRKDYLKSHHGGIYTGMMMTGSLDRHCLVLQHQAEDMISELTTQMMSADYIAPSLQLADPAEWNDRMKDIHTLAEEAVLNRLICTF